MGHVFQREVAGPCSQALISILKLSQVLIQTEKGWVPVTRRLTALTP